MTQIFRMTTRWDGFLGSPGYSNFYVQSAGNAGTTAQTFSDALHAFWSTVNGYLPAVVDLTILPTWQEFSDANGLVIEEGVVVTPAAVVSGNNSAQFAVNSGVLIEWLTGTFVGGHRLKGRTYVVPAIGVFDTDGTLSVAAAAAITGAAQTLLDEDVVQVVWHRPIGGSGGSSSPITAPRLSDTAAVLRSRGK